MPPNSSISDHGTARPSSRERSAPARARTKPSSSLMISGLSSSPEAISGRETGSASCWPKVFPVSSSSSFAQGDDRLDAVSLGRGEPAAGPGFKDGHRVFVGQGGEVLDQYSYAPKNVTGRMLPPRLRFIPTARDGR